MNTESLLRFVQAHGIRCWAVAGAVVCLGLWTKRDGACWGVDVEIVRTLVEAKAFLGY